uniref:Uncharacterized protein n=1 Tax=Graphocephala atropunctata TaxID=36148 RepID=A0A1B6KS11_9HEMI
MSSPNKNKCSDPTPVKKSLLRFPLRKSLNQQPLSAAKVKSPKATKCSPSLKRLRDSPRTLAARNSTALVSSTTQPSRLSPFRVRSNAPGAIPRNHSPSDHRDDMMRRICQVFGPH